MIVDDEAEDAIEDCVEEFWKGLEAEVNVCVGQTSGGTGLRKVAARVSRPCRWLRQPLGPCVVGTATDRGTSLSLSLYVFIISNLPSLSTNHNISGGNARGEL